MSKVVNFKNSLITFFATLLLVVVSTLNASSVNAAISPQYNYEVNTNQGFVQGVLSHGVRESISDNGLYSVTFRVATGAGRDILFPYRVEFHKCKEGNGNIHPQGYCGEAGVEVKTGTVNLNSSNNYAQEFTFQTQQNPAMKCGSFQTDFSTPARIGPEDAIGSSIYRTGVDCPNPTPTPTPTPSVSPSPSTVQCPADKIEKVVNSTVICVSQNQEQEQNQEQNNNQNQNVDQNITVNGGDSSSSSSSSSSVNLTINNPTPAPVVPQVVTQVKGAVTELPKTGLPLAALALGGLVPGGVAFRRFGKKNEEESANDIWTEKQLNS